MGVPRVHPAEADWAGMLSCINARTVADLNAFRIYYAICIGYTLQLCGSLACYPEPSSAGCCFQGGLLGRHHQPRVWLCFPGQGKCRCFSCRSWACKGMPELLQTTFAAAMGLIPFQLSSARSQIVGSADVYGAAGAHRAAAEPLHRELEEGGGAGAAGRPGGVDQGVHVTWHVCCGRMATWRVPAWCLGRTTRMARTYLPR